MNVDSVRATRSDVVIAHSGGRERFLTASALDRGSGGIRLAERAAAALSDSSSEQDAVLSKESRLTSIGRVVGGQMSTTEEGGAGPRVLAANSRVQLILVGENHLVIRTHRGELARIVDMTAERYSLQSAEALSARATERRTRGATQQWLLTLDAQDKVVISIANAAFGAVLSDRQAAKTGRTDEVGAGPPVAPAESVASGIRALAQLRDDGLISEQEFLASKTELLGRL